MALSNSASTTSIPPISITPFSYPVVKYISQEISLKLTTENFILWKAQVLPVLRTHNLIGFIDGTLQKPDQTLEDVAKWIRLDQMVLGWLLGSLSPKVLSQVVDKPTARSAWCVFESFYGKLSRACIQQLKTELQSLQKGSTTIHDFIHQAKSLALALASAGKAVDDDDLVLWTLKGLGSEYDPIVAAINSRIDPPTFEEVCALLLDYELRITSSSHTQTTAAFLAAPLPTSISRPSSSLPQASGRGSSQPSGGRVVVPLAIETVAAYQLVVVVVAPPHRLLLPLPMLCVTVVAIPITRPTPVGFLMK